MPNLEGLFQKAMSAARADRSGMALNRWYRQTFKNGDTSYFNPTSILKNGNYHGKTYSIYVDRPRAKAKGKLESVWAPELWTMVNDSDVPFHRFK